MKIEVYLDDEKDPRQVFTPPERFDLDTNELNDGKHRLTFVAVQNGTRASVRHVEFEVQNGPTIDVHGIRDGDRLSGRVSVLTNAYGSAVGDAFEVVRIETPAPIPTWAWVLFLIIVGWGVGYLSLTYTHRQQDLAAEQPPVAAATDSSDNDWAQLGAQVYGNNCASCHQATGAGLPGVFPPLVGNPAVLDADAATHIDVVLRGLSGKVINGTNYLSPMPPFAAILSDAQIAAVVNHERTQWGNEAPLVTEQDVAAARAGMN